MVISTMNMESYTSRRAGPCDHHITKMPVNPIADAHTHAARVERLAALVLTGPMASVGLTSGTPSELVWDDAGGPAGAVSETAFVTEEQRVIYRH